jgi:hypothetical protein
VVVVVVGGGGAVVVVGGGDVGGVVGGEVGGVVACVAGVWVGAVELDPELDPVPECEPCVVDVIGCVVEALGAVVDVAAGAPAVAAAGMPLFNTANHIPPTFCPCACPFFLSPSKRYSGCLWKATCQCPPPTLSSDRPFTPCGPETCAPFEARSGGQILAQAPVHFDTPGESSVKRYSVRPDAVVNTVPTPATLAVETLAVLPVVVVAPADRAGAARTRASERAAAASPAAERAPATA